MKPALTVNISGMVAVVVRKDESLTILMLGHSKCVHEHHQSSLIADTETLAAVPRDADEMIAYQGKHIGTWHVAGDLQFNAVAGPLHKSLNSIVDPGDGLRTAPAIIDPQHLATLGGAVVAKTSISSGDFGPHAYWARPWDWITRKGANKGPGKSPVADSLFWKFDVATGANPKLTIGKEVFEFVPGSVIDLANLPRKTKPYKPGTVIPLQHFESYFDLLQSGAPQACDDRPIPHGVMLSIGILAVQPVRCPPARFKEA
jgi:hypothetical protein